MKLISRYVTILFSLFVFGNAWAYPGYCTDHYTDSNELAACKWGAGFLNLSATDQCKVAVYSGGAKCTYTNNPSISCEAWSTGNGAWVKGCAAVVTAQGDTTYCSQFGSTSATWGACDGGRVFALANLTPSTRNSWAICGLQRNYDAKDVAACNAGFSNSP